MKRYRLLFLVVGIILIGLIYWTFIRQTEHPEDVKGAALEITIEQSLNQSPILVRVYVSDLDGDKSIINEYEITEPETKLAFRAVEEADVQYILSGLVGESEIKSFPILISPGQDKYVKLVLENDNDEYVFRK